MLFVIIFGTRSFPVAFIACVSAWRVGTADALYQSDECRRRRDSARRRLRRRLPAALSTPALLRRTGRQHAAFLPEKPRCRRLLPDGASQNHRVRAAYSLSAPLLTRILTIRPPPRITGGRPPPEVQEPDFQNILRFIITLS